MSTWSLSTWLENGTTWAALHLATDWLIRLVMLVYVPQRRSPAAAQLAVADFYFPHSGAHPVFDFRATVSVVVSNPAPAARGATAAYDGAAGFAEIRRPRRIARTVRPGGHAGPEPR